MLEYQGDEDMGGEDEEEKTNPFSMVEQMVKHGYGFGSFAQAANNAKVYK